MFPLNHTIRFIACLGLLAPALFAQPAPVQFPVADKVTDAIRTELQAVPLPPDPNEMTATQDPATQVKARQQQLSRLLNTADRAKAFQLKYPNRAEALEVRQLEAQSLINAALVGDRSQAVRTAALVASIRTDLRVPAKDRLKIVALSEVVRLQPMLKDQKTFLTASEASVRNLIAEFPLEAGGYEGLFRLAEAQPDETKGLSLARELLTMSAPASIKSMAQVFIDQQSLVGQSIATIADTALGKGNPVSAAVGQPIILYFWSMDNAGSIAYAQRLGSNTPPGAVLIGVSVDHDPIAAQTLVRAQALPGSQICDGLGFDGPFARALRVTPAVPVFVINASGVIREVSAQRGDFAAKFAAAIR